MIASAHKVIIKLIEKKKLKSHNYSTNSCLIIGINYTIGNVYFIIYR